MSRGTKNIKSALMAAVLASSGALGLSGTALAHHEGSEMYRTNLSTLNGSGSSGNAHVQVNGDQVTVNIRTRGASPNLPHAQHLHIGGDRNECPTLAGSDTDNDGFISSVEGLPSYGPVQVSLTTSGDVSASSGLAVTRFPVADAHGMVNYQRTFTLPNGVDAEDIKDAVIVQHGISELFEDPTMYDGEKRSSLDDSLPFEATVPAVCGALTADQGQQNKHDRAEERAERQREREEQRAERQHEREQRRNDRNNDGQNNGNTGGNGLNIGNTGPDSTNRISINDSTTVRVNNDVAVDIDNEVSQRATSGDASVERNTRGRSAVTGDAMNRSEVDMMVEVGTRL